MKPCVHVSLVLAVCASLLPLTTAEAQIDESYYLGQWGSYGTGPGQFRTPVAAAEGPDGTVYVVDTNLSRVQKFSAAGSYLTQWSLPVLHDLSMPTGVVVDAVGNVYVSNVETSNIRKYTSDGTFLMQWGTNGTGPGQFAGPYSIAMDAADYLYVAETANNRVQKFTSDGTFVSMWGTPGYQPEMFNRPQGLAVNPYRGEVYVLDTRSDQSSGRVQRFKTDGTWLSQWFLPTPGNWVRIAVDKGGIVYCTNNQGSKVAVFTYDGNLYTQWGAAGTGPGQFLNPIGISTSHRLSPFWRLYVCDTNNSRIQVFGSGLTPSTAVSWGALKVGSK